MTITIDETGGNSKGVLIVDDGGHPDPEALALLDGFAKAMGYEGAFPGVVQACDACGYYECVCGVRGVHQPGCRLRVSMECPVSVECEHGYDVCPTCDACSCGPCVAPQPTKQRRAAGRGAKRSRRGARNA